MLTTSYEEGKREKVLNKKEKEDKTKDAKLLMLITIVKNVENPLIINVDKKVFSCIGNPAFKPACFFSV